jgi:hypothetical protein
MILSLGMISNRLPNPKVLEYRGKVYSIGADDGEITIPNLFNGLFPGPLFGSSRFVSLPMAHGTELNRAVRFMSG